MLKILFLVLLNSAVVQAGVKSDELKTVDYVELSKFAGTWYQIARKPVIFERGCVCSRQTLTPMEDGKIAVLNTCNLQNPQGKLASISGEATVVDAKSNAKLKVDFGLPYKGDYWIIGLAPDYSWAIVTDPGDVSLYVLSKTPTLSELDYQQAVTVAAQQRDVSVLTRTSQEGCNYPE